VYVTRLCYSTLCNQHADLAPPAIATSTTKFELEFNYNRAAQDFVFCKEVRLGSYAPSASSLPPAAIVAAKAMAADPRAEPRYGERVPYVVSRSRGCWQAISNTAGNLSVRSKQQGVLKLLQKGFIKSMMCCCVAGHTA
jgi:hypothetical protein